MNKKETTAKTSTITNKYQTNYKVFTYVRENWSKVLGNY